ncbi:MAG: CocE/NonD family hydrolase [Solirubrobacteraceae bacterium]
MRLGKALTAIGIAPLAALSVSMPAQAQARTRAWVPERPVYGISEQKNVPVTMSDGTVLRANVYRPSDPHTGRVAAGRFPVIMVQTPYGKDTVGATSGQSGGAEAGSETGPAPYLIGRGYIDVVAEVRGTGDSGGTFSLLDPQQGADGATLVRWAARLPESNGRVGLYGPSYMGLDQFMTAAHLGPQSPLKALFPIVAGNDTYRDVAFDGGLLDAEFDIAAVTSIFGPLEEANPVPESTGLADLLNVETQHAGGLLSYNAAQVASIELGGEQAYDGESSPGALTYTTAPLRRSELLSGPIDATIYATSTRPDVELVANLEDIRPSGQAVPVTSGALLGSFRQVDAARSWHGTRGRFILPYHPYTQASVRPVPVGRVVRYDIEIFPTTALLAAGHRLRLTLTTSDVPHLLAGPQQLDNLAGGVYLIQRNRKYASYLEAPLTGAGAGGIR